MAMSGGIYRRALWLSCLFCSVFALTNTEAATRKNVNLPSKGASFQNPSAPPERNGNSISVSGQPLSGEFIPNPGSPTKGTPIKVLPRIDGSIPGFFNHARNGLKGGLIGAAGSIGLALMLAQIDAIIEDNKVKVPGLTEIDTDLSHYWCQQSSPNLCNGSGSTNGRFETPEDWFTQVSAEAARSGRVASDFSITGSTATSVSVIYCVYKDGVRQICNLPSLSRLGQCPPDSFYDQSKRSCVVPAGYVPATDPDFDAMFNFANSQNAQWLHALIKDICNGSLAPDRCFDEFLSRSPLSGPSTLNGPSTTSTTTSVGPDGISTQTTTTTNIRYDIKYGDNYYDYKKTVTTTVSKDGVTQSDTTQTEPDEIEQEDKNDDPPSEEEISPSPCAGTTCDGPAYADQYQPTDETKEQHIDSYVNRISSIPIIQAAGGLFDISVGGSCPVWTFDHQMSVLGATMPINLVFDFLCQSWFTSYGPWIRAVIYAVCVAIAIRIALL